MVEIEFKLMLHIEGAESVDSLHADIDRVMEEMLRLEETDCGIADTALSLDLEGMELLVECIAAGTDLADAAQRANATVRSAIHAAGGSTHAWDYTAHHSEQKRVEEYA